LFPIPVPQQVKFRVKINLIATHNKLYHGKPFGNVVHVARAKPLARFFRIVQNVLPTISLSIDDFAYQFSVIICRNIVDRGTSVEYY
jgi:hypothetical protein